MNINLTLLLEMVVFALFVWFTMKFVWTPITHALATRKAQIADGLAAADRGVHEQELAQERAKETLHEAKQQASEIINQAQRRAGEIVDEAKVAAQEEGDRIKLAAQAEIEQETNRAREQLRSEVSTIALAAASKVVHKEVDAKAHSKVLDELVAQL